MEYVHLDEPAQRLPTLENELILEGALAPQETTLEITREELSDVEQKPPRNGQTGAEKLECKRPQRCLRESRRTATNGSHWRHPPTRLGRYSAPPAWPTEVRRMNSTF